MSERRRPLLTHSSRNCSTFDEVRSSFDEFENAIIRNLPEAAMELIKQGISINAVSPITGLTLLEFAIVRNNLSMMQLLLAEGASIEQKNDPQWTPLLTACNVGFLEGVQLLIGRGANTRVSSSNGSTCLLMAAKNGHLPVVSYLLEHHPCQINATGIDGLNTLHHLVLLDDPDAVLDLICRGAEIDPRTPDDIISLSLAAKHHKLRALKVLLDAGAKPNLHSNKSDCALHEAIAQGDNEAVILLLQYGADRTCRGKDYLTPLQLARSLAPLRQDIINSLLVVQEISQERNPDLADSQMDREKLKKLQGEVENCIFCPITFEAMKDPVIAADGHTYERKAIKQWLNTKKESPVTRQPLNSSTLTPNLAIKHLVLQYGAICRDS